jgi:hypothetical protein
LLSSTSTPYIIIPCTFDAGVEQSFTLEIQCDNDVRVEEITPETDWYTTAIESEWDSKTAGGCVNYPTYLNNPQYLLQAQQDTTGFVVMTQTDKSDFDDLGLYLINAPEGKQQSLSSKQAS